MYDVGDSVEKKIATIAQQIYGAADVEYSDKAKESLAMIEKNGLNKELLVCMAKTPMSLSDNDKLIGRPKDFILHVKDISISNSVKFLVVLTGSILTMPGLGRNCAAHKITMDENGKIEGLF